MPKGQFHQLCIWKWSIYQGTGLRSLWGVSPWLGSASWLQLCISLQLSPRPLLKGAYSNQNLQCYRQWANWREEMWGFRENCWRWWSGEVFSSWDSVTSEGEGRVGRISQEERWCVRMECLRNSGGGSKLHLPSFECQSICHPHKATTLALI